MLRSLAKCSNGRKNALTKAMGVRAGNGAGRAETQLRVAVIAPDERERAVLSHWCSTFGATVNRFADAEHALAHLASSEPLTLAIVCDPVDDLALLLRSGHAEVTTLMRNDRSRGLDMVKGHATIPDAARVKQALGIPVFRITAAGAFIYDAADADDFVRRPYDLDELYARIRRLLFRHQSGTIRRLLSCGCISIDRDAREVYVDGTRLTDDRELTPKEFDLLVHLIERKGKVVMNREIVGEVLGAPSNAAANARPPICHLRAKLGKPAGDLIQSVRGCGYKAVDEPSAPTNGARR